MTTTPTWIRIHSPTGMADIRTQIRYAVGTVYSRPPSELVKINQISNKKLAPESYCGSSLLHSRLVEATKHDRLNSIQKSDFPSLVNEAEIKTEDGQLRLRFWNEDMISSLITNEEFGEYRCNTIDIETVYRRGEKLYSDESRPGSDIHLKDLIFFVLFQQDEVKANKADPPSWVVDMEERLENKKIL